MVLESVENSLLYKFQLCLTVWHSVLSFSGFFTWGWARLQSPFCMTTTAYQATFTSFGVSCFWKIYSKRKPVSKANQEWNRVLFYSYFLTEQVSMYGFAFEGRAFQGYITTPQSILDWPPQQCRTRWTTWVHTIQMPKLRSTIFSTRKKQIFSTLAKATLYECGRRVVVPRQSIKKLIKVGKFRSSSFVFVDRFPTRRHCSTTNYLFANSR